MAVYNGTNANNSHTSGAANDTLNGNGGNDSLNAAAGHDRLFGGTGNDNLVGGLGNDSAYGGAGNDDLYGGNGLDQLYGGTGYDQLYGGNGHDYLSNDFDSGQYDEAYGGNGNDTIYGGDYNRGANGNDYIYGEDYSSNYGDNNNDTLYGTYLYGGTGNDYAAAYSTNGDADFGYVYGGAGNDYVSGWGVGGFSVLYGGVGIDDFEGGSGTDYITTDTGHTGYGSQGEAIYNWNDAEDIIDLSSFDANANLAGEQNWSWVGNFGGGFTNTGQAGYYHDSGSTVVQGYDGQQDWQLVIVDQIVDPSDNVFL